MSKTSGIRRSLTLQARKRGHILLPWRQVNMTSHTSCARCGCMVAGDGVDFMHPGVEDCQDYKRINDRYRKSKKPLHSVVAPTDVEN